MSNLARIELQNYSVAIGAILYTSADGTHFSVGLRIIRHLQGFQFDGYVLKKCV